MNSGRELYLHQEVMLLSLKEDKGTVESGAYYKTALGATLLAELMLTGRVQVEQDKKKKFLRVIDPAPLGDALLDECLERVRTAKKRQQLQTWVSRFANTKDLKNRVARDLCRRGILRQDEDKVLKIFKRTIYPEINPLPEREIVARLNRAIQGDGEVDARTTTLVAVAQGANLLKNAVDKQTLKNRKERIKRIANGDAAGKAAQDLVQAAQMAAVMVAVSAATIAATTSTTS